MNYTHRGLFSIKYGVLKSRLEHLGKKANIREMTLATCLLFVIKTVTVAMLCLGGFILLATAISYIQHLRRDGASSHYNWTDGKGRRYTIYGCFLLSNTIKGGEGLSFLTFPLGLCHR